MYKCISCVTKAASTHAYVHVHCTGTCTLYVGAMLGLSAQFSKLWAQVQRRSISEEIPSQDIHTVKAAPLP